MAAVPRDVDTVVFPNYESMPERDDVEDPFTEVRASSTFKKACLGGARDAQATPGCIATRLMPDVSC